MKLLHTADVHLGKQFKMLSGRAEDQREQLKKTFHKALELGVKENVSVVLIAGDLFDSNHPSRELVEFVRGEFRYLAENKIDACIVPGDHDCLEVHGIYNRERFDDEFSNVFIFRNPEGEVKEYPGLDLAIFAKPNISSTSTKSPIFHARSGTSRMKHRVVAAHGDLQIPGKSADNYHPISIPQLKEISDIDYVALGHWHSMKDCTLYGKFKMPIWYAGSPELVALDQVGAGNVIIAEFNEGSISVKPFRIGLRTSSTISFDISSFGNSGDITKKIMEFADKDAIVQVALSGLNTNNLIIDTDGLEEEAQDSFFFARILDTSKLPLENIPQYPENFIQGKFVKIMEGKIKEASKEEKKIYEEALQIGLAELMGKEII